MKCTTSSEIWVPEGRSMKLGDKTLGQLLKKPHLSIYV